MHFELQVYKLIFCCDDWWIKFGNGRMKSQCDVFLCFAFRAQRGKFNFVSLFFHGLHVINYSEEIINIREIMNLLPPERANDQPFVCSVCQKRLSSKAGLDRHLRIHAREKTFVCKICLKRFSNKAYLNRHLRVHTGIRPYVCEFCEKSFTSKGSLDKHRKIHVKGKHSVCEVCQKVV